MDDDSASLLLYGVQITIVLLGFCAGRFLSRLGYVLDAIALAVSSLIAAGALGLHVNVLGNTQAFFFLGSFAFAEFGIGVALGIFVWFWTR